MADTVPDTMKAIQQTKFGDADVLKLVEIQTPVPGDGEVLVKVAAAGINPIDCQVRTGEYPLPGLPENPFPLTVGWDIAGEIVDRGETADALGLGDRVMAFSRFPGIAGAYAEYATVPITECAKIPTELDNVHAAAVPLTALTAWQAIIDNGALKSGDRVLIHAAAGGVGHLAVQFAKAKGAFVIGTGSTGNVDFIRSLGADEVIDYTKTQFEDAASNIDVQLVPFPGDFRKRCWGVMADGGRVISIKGPIAPEEYAGRDVKGLATFVHPDGGQLTEIASMIASGGVKITLDSVFPLADAKAAHERVETGHVRGKVVLEVS